MYTVYSDEGKKLNAKAREEAKALEREHDEDVTAPELVKAAARV